MDNQDEFGETLITLTADIVSAHVSNNSVAVSDLPLLINNVHGALAGLVAVCAGSDVMHPVGAVVVGGIAGVLFVVAFSLMQNRWRIDDVLGVWPLHGLAGAWGGIACGIFGQSKMGGLGGVSFIAQFIGTVGGVALALVAGLGIYGALRSLVGLRLTEEEEFRGADLTIHHISATPEDEARFS